MKAHLIASTQFHASVARELTGFETDARTWGEGLVEFAGRLCYQSWHKPNPKTATNAGYIANILQKQHYSVLEHGQVTLLLTGVSRSFTHELIRHRHFSYSELSQRFVDMDETGYVIPPAVAEGDTEALGILTAVHRYTVEAYGRLADRFTLQGHTHKRAREAARAVLTNSTETQIVVTGNFRAWREFLEKRANVHADLEIRRCAVEIAWILKQNFSEVFQDMHLHNPDGYDAVWFGDWEKFQQVEDPDPPLFSQI